MAQALALKSEARRGCAGFCSRGFADAGRRGLPVLTRRTLGVTISSNPRFLSPTNVTKQARTDTNNADVVPALHASKP